MREGLRNDNLRSKQLFEDEKRKADDLDTKRMDLIQRVGTVEAIAKTSQAEVISLQT